MSHSKRTVTDKLCDQLKTRFMRKAEMLYEKAFPERPAQEEFFVKFDALLVKLHDHLQPRPLTRPEIDTIGRRGEKALGATIKNAAKLVKQPRYREAINMDGTTRKFPDYGE